MPVAHENFNFFSKERALTNSPLAEQRAARRSTARARPSPILIVLSMIIAHGPVPLPRVVLVLQRVTTRPSWWDCTMGTSISWNSAFESPGSPSQHQSSIPRVSEASCAAAAAATAAPADSPTVSADRTAELTLLLLKTTARGGREITPHHTAGTGAGRRDSRSSAASQSMYRRGWRRRLDRTDRLVQCMGARPSMQRFQML
jgi:hypothetical protein